MLLAVYPTIFIFPLVNVMIRNAKSSWSYFLLLARGSEFVTAATFRLVNTNYRLTRLISQSVEFYRLRDTQEIHFTRNSIVTLNCKSFKIALPTVSNCQLMFCLAHLLLKMLSHGKVMKSMIYNADYALVILSMKFPLKRRNFSQNNLLQHNL